MALQLIRDWTRIARAVATDQIARLAPKLYIKLTGQTGRGHGTETPEQVAAYYRKCFFEYFEKLEVAEPGIEPFLAKKLVLEYGPGDCPGVGLLMVAYGAAQAVCVDRFPMVSLSAFNVSVLECVMAPLPPHARERAAACFVRAGDPRSGLRDDRIRYLVRRSGLSGLDDEIDLVISRAALEHVDDIDATFADMGRALKRNGIAIHEVDLKSHGLHRENPLDFLAWSPFLWRLMYAHKGVPNRWRVDRYRRVLAAMKFRVIRLEATQRAEPRDVAAIRPHLAAPYRGLSDEDLAWLGFWLVFQKEAAGF